MKQECKSSGFKENWAIYCFCAFSGKIRHELRINNIYDYKTVWGLLRTHSTPGHSKVNMLVQIVHAVQMFAAYSMLLLFFSVGSLLKSTPTFRNFIIGAFDAVTKVKLPVTSYWDSLFTDRMFHNVWHSVALDLNKKIKQGSEAPSSPVVSLTGKHCFPLLQMSKSGRPLVLNFGSCTCPIFMSQLDEFQEMANHFSHVADFCVVYIEEAHPSDGWALKVS